MSPLVKKSRKGLPKRPILWKGPEEDGITQSMLSRWLCCRERFRLKVIEGLQPTDTFNHRLEYGQMWHICEEVFATGKSGNLSTDWFHALFDYCQQLCRRYPLQQEQVVHWMNVCKVEFPIYVEYWRKHPDVKVRTPLLQEEVFDVPYLLPSGRTVKLRGKWDSVDLIGKGKSAGIYLQENKTKGEIVEAQLKRQLGFDLQTMIYLIALEESMKGVVEDKPFEIIDIINGGKLRITDGPPKIQGIRYNVVRRPLSGGKGSIKQKKGSKNIPPETKEEFYERLRVIIQEEADAAVKERRDCDFFMRWKVEVSQTDIERFKHDFLDNALEELCDWYHWVTSPEGLQDPFGDKVHFRLPYGVYNVIAEGGSSDVDEYLATESELGLTRDGQLFGELI